MNRSWPGTSTNPTSLPLGSVHHAYPRSIVSPRRFSSSQRSGSMPVSRTISDDFPWSTWPAVATTRGPIAGEARIGRQSSSTNSSPSIA